MSQYDIGTKFIANSKIVLIVALLSLVSQVHAADMLFTDHPLAGKIWDLQSHSYIDEGTLLSMNKAATVILLGETHDNPLHHEIQQRLLNALIASGSRPSLMMEQLDADSQPLVDQALAGSNRDEVLNRVTMLIKFTDWKAYQTLLGIAIDNKLPIIAANVSNLQLQPVVWKGFAAYDADDLKRLAIDEVWSESRQNYLVKNMGGAHCGKLTEDVRDGLTRSQRLRDALMVDSAISSVGRGVVAIVGSSHARRDIGLPLYFAARAPRAHVLSIGIFEVSQGVIDPRAYEADTATGDAPYDVIWFTPRVNRAQRGNPCDEIDNSRGAQP